MGGAGVAKEPAGANTRKALARGRSVWSQGVSVAPQPALTPDQLEIRYQ
jgi:hypothetical protein